MTDSEILREAQALCEVTSWTDDEAAQGASDLATTLRSRQLLLDKLKPGASTDDAFLARRESLIDVIPLLRGLGRGLVDLTTGRGLNLPALPPWAQRVDEVVENAVGPIDAPGQEVAFLGTGVLALRHEEARLLMDAANLTPRWFSLSVLDTAGPGPCASDEVGESPVIVRAWWSGNADLARIIWAARGVWTVLAGHVELDWCEVPYEDWSTCGKAYVAKDPDGTIRAQCSPTCRTRAYRRGWHR